jgi:hypothetical protein
MKYWSVEVTGDSDSCLPNTPVLQHSSKTYPISMFQTKEE